ncbi:Na+/H+ antiporter subunit E [Pontibacter mangrovi]|uniref:Cation:proton antiporter n=1 Tax=Pontibacter mangrovi TaxID=2589816 RepID=A0A501WK08_9BACT|nr:Na+/H+ antiporter subunit E [Pontibacter mangrovi]TPE45976.1 cation:proton antiporter [Pontibacter mangrovi]
MKLLFIHSALAGALVYVSFKQKLGLLPYNAATAVLLFLVVLFLLWLTSYLYRRTYFIKLPKLFSFLFFFFKELLVANLKIAYDILTPHYRMRPTVLALPLEASSDFEIAVLANLIGLTPGTLSIDVSPDRRILYVHTLYLFNDDAEQMKQHIKNGLERKILELTT